MLLFHDRSVKSVPEKESSKRVIIFDDSNNFEQSYNLVESVHSSTTTDDGSVPSDEIKRREKLRLLGCWLFGTTLRI